MEPTPLTAEGRAASWRVFALVLFSAAYFFQSSGHNEAARFDQMRSVTEHGEWWIDRFAWNTADVVRAGDHTYPGKAPGTMLLGAGPWYLLRVLFQLLPIDGGTQIVLVTYALTVLMSALPTAVISLLILRFLARNRWSVGHATLVALGYGLGSLAFPFSTLFFGHQLSAGFAFGAFYLIWANRFEPGGPALLPLLLSGLLIGFLPVIEHPGAIASGLIALYALASLGWRASMPVLVGAAAGVLPLPLYNQAAFGDLRVLGYSFYATADSTFPAHRAGVMGVSWPRLEILKEITFKPQRGLFYANPWLIFALLAPFFPRRIRGLGREFALAAAIFAGFVLFNAGYGDSIIYWGGGNSFGPRHLLIALPFAALLAALPMKSRLLAPALGALIAFTILLMLPATAVDPRLPYEPADPFLGFYLPLYSRGLFSTYPTNPFGTGASFGSSGAFNLGRVAGLSRDLEVLPLSLVWAFAALRLMRPRSTRMRFASAGLAGVVIALGLWPALPRLSPWRVEQSGLCAAVSADKTWPYFSDYALQPEPLPHPLTRLAVSPSITGREPTIASPSRVAVTFSGRFEPRLAGWHVVQIEAIGKAAIYIDGLRLARIEEAGQFHRSAAGQVYLTKARHELIVRYMSDQKDRALRVLVGWRDAPLVPLQSGMTTGACS